MRLHFNPVIALLYNFWTRSRKSRGNESVHWTGRPLVRKMFLVLSWLLFVGKQWSSFNCEYAHKE